MNTEQCSLCLEIPDTTASQVFVGNLSHFPAPVVHGIARELVHLDFSQIPAFARGRCIVSPCGVLTVDLQGRPHGYGQSSYPFHVAAYEAALRMETDDTYSFNHTFRSHYLKEIDHA